MLIYLKDGKGLLNYQAQVLRTSLKFPTEDVPKPEPAHPSPPHPTPCRAPRTSATCLCFGTARGLAKPCPKQGRGFGFSSDLMAGAGAQPAAVVQPGRGYRHSTNRGGKAQSNADPKLLHATGQGDAEQQSPAMGGLSPLSQFRNNSAIAACRRTNTAGATGSCNEPPGSPIWVMPDALNQLRLSLASPVATPALSS